jgi:DNA processing protein
MAAGIDGAAHEGALERGGATIAVLPGSADSPYPITNAGLYRRIAARGVAVSEMPPGVSVRKWMFVARNRVIAGLSRMTVVVQAAENSGSLLTARAAQGIGRELGAVPGPVTSRLSAGPNGLLRDGARLITGAQDVVEALGISGSSDAGSQTYAAVDDRPPLTGEQELLIEAIADGADTASALLCAGELGERCLPVLASLELAGRVSRAPGGRLVLIP